MSNSSRSYSTHTRIGALRRLVLPIAFLAAVMVGNTPGLASAATGGVRMDLTMQEILHADPPESEVIDTLSALLRFDRETTLRIGPATVYLTASPIDTATVRVSYALFVTGPVPDQMINSITVEYGVPLVIDDIKGKGKSTYRLLVTPYPADTLPDGIPMPTDSSRWQLIPSTYYYFHLPKQSLAMYHFPQLRNALEYELEPVRDTFDLTSPGHIDYYFLEGNCTDVIFDTRFDYAVDPSRNRVIARYDRAYSGVDVQASILEQLYRWWGYAPELLAVGASGFVTFADYYVLNERRSGQAIALDSLVRTLDFKRQPFPASFYHAASFVQWLIHTHGYSTFRDLYSKATDLSLKRAVWAVYGKTLEELEDDWLNALKHRTFSTKEYYYFARRAAAYRNYPAYYELLQRTAAAADSIPPALHRELGMAAAQLGRWQETLTQMRQLYQEQPTDGATLRLLSQTLWANGDTAESEYYLRRLIELDTSDARPYVLFGDIERARRRLDSAAALWRHGLQKTSDPDPMAFELLLRLGRYEYARKHRDSARALLIDALHHARRLATKRSQDPRVLIRVGEALLELDSLDQALDYLHLAAYVADAPEAVGRVFLDIGRCHDLAGRRRRALEAYASVLEIPATFYDRQTARYFMNNIYRH